MSKIIKLKSMLMSRKAALVLGAAGGGAVAGFMGSLPGLRIDGAKEGALTGAAYTGAAVLGSRIIFRRIRGRIIPVKVKA